MGEGGAVGPEAQWKVVTLACDGGGSNDETFPGKYTLVEECPTTIVLIGVRVTNLETK